MSNLVKQAQNLKLKDAVPALTKHAQEQWTPSKLQGRFVTWRDAYKKKYIDTGSPRPLYELMIYGFFLSYAISWPNVSPAGYTVDTDTAFDKQN